MILRIASFLTLVYFLDLVTFSVKISHVCKLYTHYLSTSILDSISKAENEFDFIVVGSGSAGSVVANRLSKHHKVLLIERGGTPFYANSIPFLAPNLLHMPETDYMYKTVEQKHAFQGSIGKVSYWPRGKMLGGSSNLNYMMYMRGHPMDYDNWANLTGDESWSYSSLLPHFKRSIEYNGFFTSDDVNHGYNYGTQSIEKSSSLELHDVLMNAAAELGYKSRIDPNGPQQEGFGPSDAYQRNGKRETSYTAFIEPLLDRRNLVISTYSQAVKLHLDKNNRCVGVWYNQHGKLKYAKARKEVIVSAGSVDSPKLLLLSGIGPKKHLAEVGVWSIKPRIDLPVGENLKDHIIVFLMPFTINRPLSLIPERDLGVETLVSYYTQGTGPLRDLLGAPAVAFFTTPSEKRRVKANWTDFQMLILNQSPNADASAQLSDGMKLEKRILDDLYHDDIIKLNSDGFTITLTIGRPKSTGFVKLASKDPSADPIIDPKYFEDPYDITRFIEAIRIVFKLVEETNAFKKINATYVDIPIGPCKDHKLRSDKYWECYLRHMSMTMYHPVSTVKMGSGVQDRTSVVDTKLRVHHVKGLRVADASIMPDLINSNTNAPAVMIGEKAAAMIREDWAKQYEVCLKTEVLLNHESKSDLKCHYSRIV